MKNEEKTLEELQVELETAKKAYELIQKMYAKKEAEEEKTKREKLAAEKQKRYDEVVEAYEKFAKLKAAYVDDYGYFYEKHVIWF